MIRDDKGSCTQRIARLTIREIDFIGNNSNRVVVIPAFTVLDAIGGYRMGKHRSRAPLVAAAGAALLLTGAFGHLSGQTPAPQRAGGRGGGGGRGGIAPALFMAMDANKDGAVTRDEFTSAFDKWFTEWDTAKNG